MPFWTQKDLCSEVETIMLDYRLGGKGGQDGSRRCDASVEEREDRHLWKKKTRNRVKAGEDSLCQLLSLFLSSKVLSDFCHPFLLELPLSLYQYFGLFPLLTHARKNGGSDRTCFQQGTSCGKWSDVAGSYSNREQQHSLVPSSPCYCKDCCGNTAYQTGSICHQDKEPNNVLTNCFV